MKIQNSASLIILAVALSAVPRPAAAQHTGTVAGVPVQIVVRLEPWHGNEVPTVTQHEVFVHQGRDLRPVTEWVPATGERAARICDPAFPPRILVASPSSLLRLAHTSR